MPRLIVLLSVGTSPTPTGGGCRSREAAPGKAERDWAQPAIASKSIPDANFHFMRENISILGEFPPRAWTAATRRAEQPAGPADLKRFERNRCGTISSRRPWTT